MILRGNQVTGPRGPRPPQSTPAAARAIPTARTPLLICDLGSRLRGNDVT